MVVVFVEILTGTSKRKNDSKIVLIFKKEINYNQKNCLATFQNITGPKTNLKN